MHWNHEWLAWWWWNPEWWNSLILFIQKRDNEFFGRKDRNFRTPLEMTLVIRYQLYLGVHALHTNDEITKMCFKREHFLVCNCMFQHGTLFDEVPSKVRAMQFSQLWNVPVPTYSFTHKIISYFEKYYCWQIHVNVVLVLLEKIDETQIPKRVRVDCDAETCLDLVYMRWLLAHDSIPESQLSRI